MAFSLPIASFCISPPAAVAGAAATNRPLARPAVGPAIRRGLARYWSCRPLYMDCRGQFLLFKLFKSMRYCQLKGLISSWWPLSTKQNYFRDNITCRTAVCSHSTSLCASCNICSSVSKRSVQKSATNRPKKWTRICEQKQRRISTLTKVDRIEIYCFDDVSRKMFTDSNKINRNE